MGVAVTDPRSRPIGRLLQAQQAAEPDRLVETLAEAGAGIGAWDVVLYLIDYEQSVLIPHAGTASGGDGGPPIASSSVDGSMPGRAFQDAAPLMVEREDGVQVWVPVRERVNKLGVLAMMVPRWDEDVELFCVELGLAAAYLLMASAHYSDLPHLQRRREDMSLAAEMQWALLPPLSFASGTSALAGLLEPAYEVGGDCFDYAINNGVLDFAIFDCMGHGLNSAVLASLVVGAYRHGRRAGQDLPELTASIDAAVRTFPGPLTFATALLARLDIATGELAWLTCGHPQPIIIRRETALGDTDITPGLPLGLGALGSVTAGLVQLRLEPDDGLLLFTDGVLESRNPEGEPFGTQRLRDLLVREHLARVSPQEIVRRLVRATIAHNGGDGPLRDDASMLYLRWNTDAPQT
jgi:serine phosphatase RsbU (regulator of sigma subunit)